MLPIILWLEDRIERKWRIELRKDNIDINEEIRLNKFMSDAGFCSRREADRLIEKGEVYVDGFKAVVGQKVKQTQLIECKGRKIGREEELILLAFNKPRGIICSTVDKEGDNIVDFINFGKRIYPIGRLDKESEGLILLTNDGGISDKILRSRNNHEKEYIVTVNKNINEEFIKVMAKGVPILDVITKKCVVEKIDNRTFRIILTQGLNRQIRRMCEYFGYKVIKLKRIRICNIELGDLPVGKYRNISKLELKTLKELL